MPIQQSMEHRQKWPAHWSATCTRQRLRDPQQGEHPERGEHDYSSNQDVSTQDAKEHQQLLGKAPSDNQGVKRDQQRRDNPGPKSPA